MAASTGLLLQFLKPGDHLVISDVSHAGVAEFANAYLPAHGIEVSRIDLSQPENPANGLSPNTRQVYAETPANPILKLTDGGAVLGKAEDLAILKKDVSIHLGGIISPSTHG